MVLTQKVPSKLTEISVTLKLTHSWGRNLQELFWNFHFILHATEGFPLLSSSVKQEVTFSLVYFLGSWEIPSHTETWTLGGLALSGIVPSIPVAMV